MERKYLKTVVATMITSVITISGMAILKNPIIINASTLNNDFSVVMKDVSFNRAEGTEFEVPISVNKLPNGIIKSGEIVVSVPKDFEVIGVTLNKDVMEAKDIDYNVDTYGDEKLRIALTDLATGELKINKRDGEQVIVNLKLRVKSGLQTGTKNTIAVDRMIFRGTENTEVSYSFKGSESVVEATGGDITATPRILYTGDGTDLIPSDKMGVAVEVRNASAYINHLTYGNGGTIPRVEFLYNKEISEKNNVRTYVGICSTNVNFDDLKVWSKYYTSTNTSGMFFGDERGNGIDAEDALKVLSQWLRKSSAKYDKDILLANVNGDGAINTLDVTDMVDKYVSNKELPILSK